MKNLPLGFGTFLIDSWRCYKKCIPQWLIIGEKLFYRIIDDHRWPPPSFSRIRRFRFTLSQARKNWEKRVSEIAYFENPFFPFCTHSTMSYCIKQNCRRLENQRVGGVCAKRTKKKSSTIPVLERRCQRVNGEVLNVNYERTRKKKSDEQKKCQGRFERNSQIIKPIF